MRKHRNICPDCGAWLDPCETCDCHEGVQDTAKQPEEKAAAS